MPEKEKSMLGEWKLSSEKEMQLWAAEFSHQLFPGQTLLLKGGMGSGKTTMVINLLNALNGEEASSPTFSLVNEYRYPGGMIYHFDLYRIEQPEELFEIGFEEYLDSNAISIVEWPEVGEDCYYEDNTTTILIELLPDSGRLIKWIKGIEL